MATLLTDTTFSSVYKDDYADSDNYHRILFNSGKALQARELTQMQTIIQNEIARFARNIFLEGAMVNPGGTSINPRYEYIKLDTSANPLPTDPTTLIGKTLIVKSPDPAIRVKVIDFVAADATTGDPATLYVIYTDTSAGTSGPDPIRVPNGATLENATITDLKVAAFDAAGQGTIISCAAGDYFTQNHFVYASSQTIFLSKYSNTPTADLGFRVDQEIITADDETALYDNQGAVPNAASPGADRYRIRLTLTTRDQIDSDQNFVYVARIVGGRIVHTADGKSDYNKINELMAQRTREESGDYVVRDFRAKFNNIPDNDSNLSLDVSGGIAYVDGYRLEVPATKITVPKARDILTVENETVIARYGNWIRGDATNNKGLPNVDTFESVNLRSSTNYGGSTIGTGRVRFIEEDGANLKFYFFDVAMNTGQNFRDVRSFGDSSNDYVNVVLTDGIAQLSDAGDNTLLWPLGRTRPTTDGISVDSITVQRREEFTTGVGVTTASLTPSTGYSFVNLNSWIISEKNGPIATGVSFTYNGTAVDISGLTGDKTYELLTLETYGSPVARVKSLQRNVTFTKHYPDSADSDGLGLKWLQFPHADIYQLNRVRIDDSDGNDLSSVFTFDNGQRDNYYAPGRLIAKQGYAIPSGRVYAKYDYFQHQSGQYFSVNSYNGIIDYEDIPSYRKSNGETISLRDVLDFRSVKISNTEFGAIINQMPGPTAGITADINYYLPRRDKLIVINEGNEINRVRTATVKVVQGTSSTNPQYPSTPTGGLALYNLELNPYTLHDSDVKTEIISNKRFTMKDIARLEKRIDDLVELTTLSLLETNTSILDVLDSTGANRTKSGFLADNFINYAYSDTRNPEYRASIDPKENTVTPSYIVKNTRLWFDSDHVSNSNVVLNGDLLTLSYTDQTFFNQNLATEAMNINPFSVISGRGYMTLSPSSDDWYETEYMPDVIVDGGSRAVNTGRIMIRSRNAHMYNWYGSSGTKVIVGTRVVREEIEDKIVDVSFIPWMRSKKVAFQVYGLRPNTRYFAYFNGTPVFEWVREESEFLNFSRDDTDYSNVYNTATEHPDGATELYSDATGVMYGTFFIPSTPTARFRTGQVEFKLLDISVNEENNAISIAKATFTSTGILTTRQKTFQSVRETLVQDVTMMWCDPLAQSFEVNRIENPNGIFVTKVDIFFKTKESIGGAPVSCEIRTMENGIPTSIRIPGAVKYLLPSEVSIPANTEDLTSVRATPTSFVFDEPVYLAPNNEYAVVLTAQSTAYEVYVAKTYDFLIGTTSARVTKQPSLGSLFQSQNASTWSPDQTRDLMFKLYRADFNTSGTAYIENGAVPSYALPVNPFQYINGDNDIQVFHPGHGFVLNDAITISGMPTGLTDSNGGIPNLAVNGTRLITYVDHTGYKFAAQSGSIANASVIAGGTGIVVTPNIMFDEFTPTIQTLTPDTTSIAAQARLTSGASYADNRNKASNSAYSKSNTFNDIVLNQTNYLTSPAIIANSLNEYNNLGSGNKSFTMKLALTTADTKVSPIIDLQRASMTLIENVIDDQDASSTTNHNVPIRYTAETDPNSGSSAAKHLTTQVSLKEEAVGLKIILGANRPASSDFDLYYRTALGDAILSDQPWVYLDRLAEPQTDEDPGIFRDYEYLAGGLGGELPSFTKFQVKIVMKSTNSSKIPVIKDLRAIALAV